MNTRNILQKIGLNKNDAELYLAALELGEGTMSAISKASGKARSSCYETVNSLISQGLITPFR